jgi:hypothetical protein
MIDALARFVLGALVMVGAYLAATGLLALIHTVL